MQVELQGAELWRRFHEIGTEMIITKAGRYRRQRRSAAPSPLPLPRSGCSSAPRLFFPLSLRYTFPPFFSSFLLNIFISVFPLFLLSLKFFFPHAR